MDISISSEAQFGMNWPRWQALTAAVERLGFAGLYRADHYTIQPAPPDADALETIVSLAYTADHTKRIRFGTLVAPLSMRDPIMLARQASALDDLSGGRMVLGLGAGWNEREHTIFGYPLGDNNTRFGRFSEGLEAVTRLLRTTEPVTVSGKFVNLKEALLLPHPTRPGGPRILVGGGGLKRTMPLAARYADIWNGDNLSPEGFKERSTILDGMVHAAGRRPQDIQRTLTLFIVCGRDAAELERRVAGFRGFVADFAKASTADILHALRTGWNAFVGSPAEVVDQMNAYTEAGVEELMLHWVDVEGTEGLDLLAEQVLPHIK